MPAADNRAKRENVIEAYSTGFRAGMSDLSAPSPAPLSLALDAGAIASADLEFPTAGGSLALRRAVALRYETLSADDILIANGGSEALAALAAAVAAPGTRIAVAAGAYASFTEVARLAGADLLPWTARTSAQFVLANNPTVPGGQRLDLERLLRESHEDGAIVIADEVYRSIALTGDVPTAAADLSASAVSVADLSKPLGLGGLRIGWIATRNVELREAALRWLRLFTGGPSVLSELAGLHALASFDERIAVHAAYTRANAPKVYDVLREGGWSFAPAALGVTVCARPPRTLAARDLRELNAKGSFMAPGDAFGQPGAMRISLLTPPEVLRTALRVLTPPRGRDALVILTRVPRPGFGKSRLAATLGTCPTYRLARAFLQDTALLRDGPWRTLAAYTPASDGSEAGMLVPGAEAVPQVEGDLGARIIGALDDGLRLGERAVLIGSDTPDLPHEIVARAFAALDDADVVFGPARDGGFYLIGVRVTHPAMFDGVEWSTDRVYAQAATNARGLGWRIAVLDQWDDVDDHSSLVALARRIEGTTRAAATQAVLAAVGLMPRLT